LCCVVDIGAIDWNVFNVNFKEFGDVENNANDKNWD
jgi:hypothetical protein